MQRTTSLQQLKKYHVTSATLQTRTRFTQVIVIALDSTYSNVFIHEIIYVSNVVWPADNVSHTAIAEYL